MGGGSGQNFERRPQQNMGGSGGGGGGNSNMGAVNTGNDMFSRRGQTAGGGQNRNQNSGGFGGNDGGNFGGPQNFNQGMNR